MRISAKWLVAAIVLAVVSAASVGWLHRHKTNTTAVFASANGRVEAIEYEITIKRAGRITKLLVQEGEAVEPGQIVAEIESRDERDEERQAEAEFRLAGKEFDQAKMSVAQKERDFEAASAALIQREREFVITKDEFDRSRQLVAKELIARQELSELEHKLRIAEAALARDQARKQAAEAALKAVEFQVKQKQADFDKAQTRAKRTRPQTEDRFLRATHRGLVLARTAKPQTVVAAGSSVLTLLGLEDIYMTISLPRAQAERVSVDSEARVVLDAAPDQVFPGVVALIAPDSRFSAGEVKEQRDGEKSVLRIKIKIDAEPLRQRVKKIDNGLTGTAYVRLDAVTPWPESLQLKPPRAAARRGG